MKLPSTMLLVTAALQIVIGGTLGLGLFGVPQFGMRGVASGQLIAYAIAALFLAFWLFSGRSKLRLNARTFRLQRGMFFDILKVGAIACLSPLQSVITVLIFTRLLSPYGTVTLAGYGIGARLEFMLVPIAASIGIASVPIVGMNVGAGNIERARKVAWTAGLLAASVVGSVGLILAGAPDLWAANFTNDPRVLEAARQYFHLAGPAFGFLGLALSLYFASQGSGKILGPVLAQSGRLAVVVLGGILLLTYNAPGWTLFLLAAASMVVYGILAVLSVWLTTWGPSKPGSKVV
jgi:Na+-driven multidrug efflux pump